MNKKFYVTTPIYYVNDRPHIGHAYTTLVADILTRYHKQKKEKVFFLTGTDEHGLKIAAAAEQAKKPEREFVAEKARVFKKAWKMLSIEYNNFIRTTNSKHIKAVKNALDYLYKNKFIYKGFYQGFYCQSCEQYKMADDLVDGKCPDHQIEPKILKEESYFFKLSRFEKILKKKIENDELEIKPIERKNEVLAFLEKGLKDISISRKAVFWGIPLPFDKKFTLYVWIDAFLNYLTGLGWQGKAKRYPEFFPPDLQLMSKDILRVHATIWPALLLALKMPLPKKIFVHGYFTIEGQKMSKSIGNVIWPEDLVEKFGVDGARYLLISSLSYGQDGDVSWEKLIKKYNADLANGLGNLISRIIGLNSKFKIQKSKLKLKIKNYNRLLEEFKFKEALELIWSKIAWANKYIEEKRLWELVKINPKEGERVLSEIFSLIAEISEKISPFMPETSMKIKKILKSRKSEPLFPRVK